MDFCFGKMRKCDVIIRAIHSYFSYALKSCCLPMESETQHTYLFFENSSFVTFKSPVLFLWTPPSSALITSAGFVSRQFHYLAA